VRLRFREDITQSHPGSVAVEPDGRIVVAHVVNRDHFMTTVLNVRAFSSIHVAETENAITFSDPVDPASTFRAVTIASRT
jgi:hypothetical protein